jgi:hypothetical protein
MAALRDPAIEVDTTEDLDQAVDDYLDWSELAPADTPTPRPRPVVVRNDADLSRVLERARAAAHEIRQLEMLAEERQAEVEAWLERATRAASRRQQWFEEQATVYALNALEDSDKARVTITVPEGKVVAKQPEPEYEIDHAVLGAFLAAIGLHEYVTREVAIAGDWKAVKKLSETPAGSPGTTVTPTLGGMPLQGVTAKPRLPTAEVTLS